MERIDIIFLPQDSHPKHHYDCSLALKLVLFSTSILTITEAALKLFLLYSHLDFFFTERFTFVSIIDKIYTPVNGQIMTINMDYYEKHPNF